MASRIAGTALFLPNGLISVVEHFMQMLPRLHGNRRDGSLPVHVGGSDSSPNRCNVDEKVKSYHSWAKFNLMLSFTAGIALLSVPSTLIKDELTLFCTYAVGVYAAFLISMAVYFMASCLCNIMVITILSISSAATAAAFGLALKVVLFKGATASPSAYRGL